MQRFEFCIVEETEARHTYAAKLTPEGLIVCVGSTFGARKERQDIPKSAAYQNLMAELIRQGWQRLGPSLYFKRRISDPSVVANRYRTVGQSATYFEGKGHQMVCLNDVTIYELTGSGLIEAEKAERLTSRKMIDAQIQQFESQMINDGWQQVRNRPSFFFKSDIEAGNEKSNFSSGAVSDPVLLLQRLGELHTSGVLTDSEFQSKKADILNRM